MKRLGFLGEVRKTVAEDFQLDPKCDIVFKAIFTQGKQGSIALLGLLNAVLYPSVGKKIVKIVYLNTHVHIIFKKQKKPVMDIMVSCEDDSLINIEMQIDNRDNFSKRTQHYLACMVHDQAISGEAYDRLKPCITINILDFTLNTGLTDFHTCYRMHETSRLTELPSNLTEIHFIELPKLIDYTKGTMPNGTLARWAFYFKDLPQNRHPKILEQIFAEEKEINMAEQARKNITFREKFIYAYRSYQRAKMDETSSRMYLHDKDIKEGIEIGMEKGKLEVASRLKSQGIDAEVIAKATLLSIEEIAKI